MNRPLTAACLSGVLLLAGCGGASDSPSDTATVAASQPTTAEVTPSAEPVPTSTPTPEPISREEAGANYVALADAVNAQGSLINPLLESGDVAGARVAATDTANALRAFVDGLIANEWPAEVQPAIDKLISETSAEIPIWLSAAATTTDEDFWAQIYTLPSAPGSANEVRILLGLDNVPITD